MTITNQQIEAKAREICKNLGLDPDDRVGLDYYGGAMTPKEYDDWAKNGTGITCDVYWTSQRWRNYRKEAAIYLAASLETLKEDTLEPLMHPPGPVTDITYSPSDRRLSWIPHHTSTYNGFKIMIDGVGKFMTNELSFILPENVRGMEISVVPFNDYGEGPSFKSIKVG